MRRLLALTLAATVCLVPPAAAGGPNHVVTASPTADGQKIHSAGVQVATTGADTVDSTNLARATPHDCTGCEGIAVAFQAVIATGRPSTVSPSNVAAAVNSNCTSCGAFAFAYQYVVTTDSAAHLSDDGRAKVNAIRDQADQLIDEGLPYDQLDAKLQDLATQFHDTIVGDLQSNGDHPHDGHGAQRDDRAGDEPS